LVQIIRANKDFVVIHADVALKWDVSVVDVVHAVLLVVVVDVAF
jgi:hypothetical protein